jgi:hypothetical protein
MTDKSLYECATVACVLYTTHCLVPVLSGVMHAYCHIQCMCIVFSLFYIHLDSQPDVQGTWKLCICCLVLQSLLSLPALSDSAASVAGVAIVCVCVLDVAQSILYHRMVAHTFRLCSCSCCCVSLSHLSVCLACPARTCPAWHVLSVTLCFSCWTCPVKLYLSL